MERIPEAIKDAEIMYAWVSGGSASWLAMMMGG